MSIYESRKKMNEQQYYPIYFKQSIGWIYILTSPNSKFFSITPILFPIFQITPFLAVILLLIIKNIMWVLTKVKQDLFE